MISKNLFHGKICLVFIAILIVFLFYKFELSNNISYNSSKNLSVYKKLEIQETKIQKLPEALIIGSPKCGKFLYFSITRCSHDYKL